MVKKVMIYVAVFAAGALAVVAYVTWSQPAPTELSATEESAALAASEVTPEDPDATGVTSISDVTRNTMVTLSGTVQRITDEDEFILEDSTGTIPVWTGNQFFAVSEGEAIRVTGFIDDDLLIELYAQQIMRADGAVVSIGGSEDR